MLTFPLLAIGFVMSRCGERQAGEPMIGNDNRFFPYLTAYGTGGEWSAH